jgi:primase-polymerase (primpol)-like protein
MSSDVKTKYQQAKHDTLPVHFDSIPDLLTGRDQWIVWRYEWKGDKMAKVPLNSKRGHRD